MFNFLRCTFFIRRYTFCHNVIIYFTMFMSYALFDYCHYQYFYDHQLWRWDSQPFQISFFDVHAALSFRNVIISHLLFWHWSVKAELFCGWYVFIDFLHWHLLAINIKYKLFFFWRWNVEPHESWVGAQIDCSGKFGILRSVTWNMKFSKYNNGFFWSD